MEKCRNIKNNTLFNELIRIDIFKIENLLNIVNSIEEMMKKYSYSLNITNVNNININIEDPETLLTQEIISSNVNKTTNYEYISTSGNDKFVLNEYFLIFEKKNFQNYSKIDKYLEIMEQIINKIISINGEVKVSRVGIRKMNQLFFSEKVQLREYINDSKFLIPMDDIKILDEYATVQKNLDNEGYSSNIMFNLKKGRGQVNGNKEEIPMYRCVWDIDCYSRNQTINNVAKIIEKLNIYLFNRYTSIITDKMYGILKHNNLTEEYLNGLGIYGGINKNEE